MVIHQCVEGDDENILTTLLPLSPVHLKLEALLTGMSESNLKAMQLGLSHSLSRYKLKFSADKVDTMIVQVR